VYRKEQADVAHKMKKEAIGAGKTINSLAAYI